ncbi:MAG TPA: NAD(P)/FAD-dependent oxidoreductase, partial [Burkholderiales bacterium]|nr:NAD(P)/FAD-dependent oxidoreductase [Burkholderiales bacterium]
MTASEHFDVLIVGAGLSGIGAACHLQAKCPGKRYLILEARGATGGTWDLFRYPGVRSDSDMFTLGYAFRPWRGEKSIVEGPAILAYLRDTAAQHGVDRHIRLRHRVTRAAWSSAEARWTVQAEVDGKAVGFTCNFLFMCSGYYSYDGGYLPAWPGLDRYKGTVVHPQAWPEDLDYAGKRVVVIGSGATAVTLVPAMAERARHVTMLQRSPTYVVAMPARDPVARFLSRFLPAALAYRLVRFKNVLRQLYFYSVARRKPEFFKERLARLAQAQLGPAIDVARHFSPRYNPWDQRLCLAADGDLFAALKDGKASIVTDSIESFSERGLRLASGAELEADVVVTATGLELKALGGLTLAVDGVETSIARRLVYKSMMFDGIPNFAFTMGYLNASWTLKSDLAATFLCRLLNHMSRHGYASCVARYPDPGFEG